MACFLVPTAEAIIATAVSKILQSREKRMEGDKALSTGSTGAMDQQIKIPFSRKLSWLYKMLWGGALLLAYEHVWHGEVVPWFPFLTAASDPSDAAVMLHEMATVGVSMAITVTAAWCVMLIVSNVLLKRKTVLPAEKKQGASV